MMSGADDVVVELMCREQQLYQNVFNGVKQQLNKENIILYRKQDRKQDSKQDCEIAIAVKKVIEEKMTAALRSVKTISETPKPEEVT